MTGDDDHATDREDDADPLAWSDAADVADGDADPGEAAPGSGGAGVDADELDEPASSGWPERADSEAPAATEDPASFEDGTDGPRTGPGGGDELPDGLFEEQEVAELDADAVWDHVETDDAPDVDVERGDERVVESAALCERCPYFSEPPAVRCTHPGTEILEVLDMERFRVVDCPKVWESERLERL